MELEIFIAAAILLGLVFTATVDMAFSHLSDVGLRRLASDEEAANKKDSASFLREILENRPRFRFALSSVIQVFLICVAVLVTVIVSEFIPTKLKLLVASLAISVTATVLVRQIIPRLIIRNDTEKKLLFLLPVIRPMYAFVSYFVDPIANRKRAKALQRLETTIAPDSAEDRADDNAEDFQALMEVGEAEGIIEEDERELIETMIDFGDTLAGEIMTPRTGIVGIAVGTSIKDARDVIIEEKYSRLPVYRDTIDNVEGMIYVRDLLAALATGQKENAVETIMRDAFFVPETKTASELLKSMQQNHVQIAVVIDEYGGVAGLVTVEDIIEEIVGEIEDEDTEQEEVIEIIEGEGGYYDVLGSTEIDKVERIFDIELEDDEYTTIAGLVTSEAGYVPKVGDKLDLKGLAIEILQADEKRITLLRLRKTDPPKTDEDADD
ncbi:MAG: HlyC/CorC family transporter [Pyrinomonadaceae bacterium]|nr:HlyC/CorC family transporter [Pyrinomonadaceae bacterium]